MNCYEVDELAPAYALAVLSPDEREAVEAHLATCDAHASTYAQLQDVAALLPVTAYEIEPPARLRDAISRAIRADLQPELPAVKPALRVVPRTYRAFPRGLATIAAAIVIALLGFGAFQAFESATGEPEVFERHLSNAQGASARIVYFESHELALIHTEGLEPLPPGQTYQLWSMASGKPVNRGVLTNVPAGTGISVIFGDIPRREPCFVTIEATALSSSPTGPTVLTTASGNR